VRRQSKLPSVYLCESGFWRDDWTMFPETDGAVLRGQHLLYLRETDQLAGGDNQKLEVAILSLKGRMPLRHLTQFLGTGFVCTMLVLPLTAFGAPNDGRGPTTHDCAGVAKSCGAWGASGTNTYRTCQQAQCKTENGHDVMAGKKTQTECYEGHGAPPTDLGMTRPPVTKVPMAPRSGA